MDNQKYVLESFNEFLKYKDYSLNEKKEPGTPLDLAGAEELVKLIMTDNALLLEKFYSKVEGLKNSYNKEAAKSLKDGKYAVSGLQSIAATVLTRTPNEMDLKVIQALDPSIKEEDLKALTNSKNRKSKAGEMMKMLGSLSEDEAKKRAQEIVKILPKNSSYIAPGIKTPFIWGGLLSDEERNQTYSSFLAEAQKRGYDTVEGLKKVIDSEFRERSKKESTSMDSPGLRAFMDKTESTEVKPNQTPLKPFKTAIVKEEKQSEVFKQNMYGANGEADYMEGTFKEMVDNLGAIFQRVLTGEIQTIKSITVYTSADRYRNTGAAEKLSWGQLSFLRSQSMASIVVEMARKSGLPEEVVTKINQMIKLNFKGGNGDGTTGPNAPDPIKFGYYVEEGGKSIWKDGKDRNIIQVVQVDNEGTPQGEPKDIKKSPDANKEEYSKYRYNNIEIEYIAPEGDRTIPDEGNAIEKVIDLKYPIKIKIPSRYRKKTIKIPIPTINIGASVTTSGGGSKGATPCPDFGSSGGGAKVRTGFGFGIRTVTIASWESDITK